MRFLGVHLVGGGYANAFGKVQAQLAVGYAVAFFVIGILCASVHFSYGIWLFCAKWGITAGERGRRNAGYVCAAICLVFLAPGYLAMYSFLTTSPQPVNAHPAEQALVNR